MTGNEFDPKDNIMVIPFENKLGKFLWLFVGDIYIGNQKISPQIMNKEKVLITTHDLPDSAKGIDLDYTSSYRVENEGYNFVYTLTYYTEDDNTLIMRRIYDIDGKLLISGELDKLGFFINDVMNVYDSKGNILNQYNINDLRKTPIILNKK